jgi:hypothetical protein
MNSLDESSKQGDHSSREQDSDRRLEEIKEITEEQIRTVPEVAREEEESKGYAILHMQTSNEGIKEEPGSETSDAILKNLEKRR